MSTIAVQIPLRLQYPIEEGAALLGISRHTLIRDIRRGLVKTTRYGKRVLIPKDELFRLAAEGVQPKAKQERGTAPGAGGTLTGRIGWPQG